MVHSLVCLSFLAATVCAAPVPQIRKDVVFGKGSDVDLKLDIATPEGAGPFPAVVCIHGGAWQKGNRTGHHQTIQLLAQHGFVAATVQYRLTPRHPFPAQIEDVKCAVRFLRARAKALNLDPSRIGALGDSAGGHLALLLGTLDPADGLEGKGGHADQSSKVQAVVNYYGPTDLPTWAPTELGDGLLKLGMEGKSGNALLQDFIGTSDRKADIMKKASPLTYIDSNDAPVLTFQGTIDPLVQPQQAQVLHAALRKAGVTEQLEILESAGHGWGGALRERTNNITVEFLNKRLKGRK